MSGQRITRDSLATDYIKDFSKYEGEPIKFRRTFVATDPDTVPITVNTYRLRIIYTTQLISCKKFALDSTQVKFRSI